MANEPFNDPDEVFPDTPVEGTRYVLGAVLKDLPSKVRRKSTVWERMYDALPEDGAWREIQNITKSNTGYRRAAKAAHVEIANRGDKVLARRTDA